MAKKTAKQTGEEKAMALTSDGIFRAMENAVPEGAKTLHVLEAAATLIGSSLVQMNATKQDLHAVIAYIENYVMKKLDLKTTD